LTEYEDEEITDDQRLELPPDTGTPLETTTSH
jgi:hypothetical protein